MSGIAHLGTSFPLSLPVSVFIVSLISFESLSVILSVLAASLKVSPVIVKSLFEPTRLPSVAGNVGLSVAVPPSSVSGTITSSFPTLAFSSSRFF